MWANTARSVRAVSPFAGRLYVAQGIGSLPALLDFKYGITAQPYSISTTTLSERVCLIRDIHDLGICQTSFALFTTLDLACSRDLPCGPLLDDPLGFVLPLGQRSGQVGSTVHISDCILKLRRA